MGGGGESFRKPWWYQLRNNNECIVLFRLGVSGGTGGAEAKVSDLKPFGMLPVVGTSTRPQCPSFSLLPSTVSNS